MIERFDVAGVPTGTPVSATLVYRLDGRTESGCGGSTCGLTYVGRLICGTDSVSADASIGQPGSVTRMLATTLMLPVTIVAGSPLEAAFTLLYSAGAGGGGDAQGVGTYGIAGLPPGVRAVNCYGADVTPVRRSTWGGVKATYR